MAVKPSLKIAALVLVAAALVYGAILLSGAVPMAAISSLIQGTLGTPRAIEGTLKEVTPLLLAGIAVFVALRAGLFNIGVEGQFMVGALACAVVALRMPGPAGMLLGVLAGMVLGGLWALPAALIKALRGGHEVITTIMLNNIAVQLTTALAAGVFKDSAQQGSTTASLPAGSMLPGLGGQPKLSLALFVGLGLVFAVWVWMNRSVAGYEMQAVGANARAATLAGIDAKRVTIRAMVISGVIGGLAGALQVLAFEGRFFAGFSGGYGFDALGVALLAGSHPLLLIPSAALFGILAKGSTTLQIVNGVPKGISTLILGLLIVIFAAIRYRKTVGRDN